MGFGDEKSHACRRCSAVSLPCHRHKEFLKFLPIIDREVPKGLAVHLILDSYGTTNIPTCNGGGPSTRGLTGRVALQEAVNQ